MNDASDPRAVPDDREHGADVLAAYRAANAAASGGAPAAEPAPTTAGSDADAPRPETRAAILAAAARAVQARPVAVGANPAPRGTPARFRYRAPLALAASLLVGTVAWQLAAQFDAAPAPAAIPDQATAQAPTPSATSPAVSASDAARSAQAGAASPAAEPLPGAAGTAALPTAPTAARAPANADVAAAARPATASTEVAEKSVAVRSAEAPASAAPKPEGSYETPHATSSVSRTDGQARDTASPPAPTVAPAAPALRMQPPKAAGPAESTARASEAGSAPARAEEQVRTQPVERRLFNEAPPVRPLPAWLERIAELRRAGRDAEAEVELQALRRTYPQAQVPPELLAPQPR